MIDQELMQIIQLDTESMYKLFFSLCNDANLVMLVKYGDKRGLANTEISELLNPYNDKKPKSEYIYIRKKKIKKDLIRAELEARTKIMVTWFQQNLSQKNLTRDRSQPNPAITKNGINYDKLGVTNDS